MIKSSSENVHHQVTRFIVHLEKVVMDGVLQSSESRNLISQNAISRVDYQKNKMAALPFSLPEE